MATSERDPLYAAGGPGIGRRAIFPEYGARQPLTDLLVADYHHKYCLVVMRADNQGEGGTLALMSMTGANWSGSWRVLVVMGLFGAALFYGDGLITPAISVMSALEGLNVATDVFKPHIATAVVGILVVSFRSTPRHHTDRQSVRPGDAVVVCWHCRARRRRYFTSSCSDLRQGPPLLRFG